MGLHLMLSPLLWQLLHAAAATAGVVAIGVKWTPSSGPGLLAAEVFSSKEHNTLGPCRGPCTEVGPDTHCAQQ